MSMMLAAPLWLDSRVWRYFDRRSVSEMASKRWRIMNLTVWIRVFETRTVLWSVNIFICQKTDWKNDLKNKKQLQKLIDGSWTAEVGIPRLLLHAVCVRRDCYRCITETMDYLLSTGQQFPQAPSVPRVPGPPPVHDPGRLSGAEAEKYVIAIVIVLLQSGTQKNWNLHTFRK